MFNLTYDQIVTKILEKSNLSKEEIEFRVNEKLKDLSDLISKEGAAHIIANELNIKVVDSTSKDMHVKDILPGMKLITINAKVINIYETREFVRNDKKARVKSLLIGDETGVLRLVIWDENIINKTDVLREGDIIKVKGVYSKENNSFKELHMGSNSQLMINPEGVTIGEVSLKREVNKKRISELNENENVELTGTIIQIFEPRTFEVCPICDKKVSFQEDKFVCNEHGVIEPKTVPLINIFLDDGSGDIRAVAFRDNAEKIIGLPIEEIKETRTDPSKFELLKQNLLGKQYNISGRTTMNMFNKLEFIINNIEPVSKVEVEKVI